MFDGLQRKTDKALAVDTVKALARHGRQLIADAHQRGADLLNKPGT